MARSTARKRALNTLYEADEKSQDILSLLAERIASPGAQTPLPDYALELVRGVADHLDSIDAALDAHSTGWKLHRMAVVDRNILRIASWEIVYNPDVPDRVAIDEALALAKILSDGDAPSFIHGLLSAVSADKQHTLDAEEVKQKAASQPSMPDDGLPDLPTALEDDVNDNRETQMPAETETSKEIQTPIEAQAHVVDSEQTAGLTDELHSAEGVASETNPTHIDADNQETQSSDGRG